MAYINDKKVFTVYRVEETTDVEANPSGSATDTLEKLRVGNVIYQVPQGNEVHLYNHCIVIDNLYTSTNYTNIKFNIYTTLSRTIASISDLSNLFYETLESGANIPMNIVANGVITINGVLAQVISINMFVTQPNISINYIYPYLVEGTNTYSYYVGSININSSENYRVDDTVLTLF